MTALDPLDRQLLDFLCAVDANQHCRIASVKTRLRPSLRRLRYAGLVWFDSFTPSASTMTDWRARNMSPTPPGGASVEEPPRPKAADEEGGAVARLPSAPPTSETFKCGHERTPENTKLDHGKWARCKACTAKRHRAYMKAKRERDKESRSAESEPLHYAEADRQERRSNRRVAAIRRATSAKARERIEQGLDARTATQAAVRHAQFAIEQENKIRARLSDPVGQAKAKLQRRYKPVVSMAVYGGDPKLFVVGNRQNVSEAELLEMAEKVAA